MPKGLWGGGSAGTMLPHLQRGQLGHGPAPLVRNVVDDKDAARKGHLVVVAVVRLIRHSNSIVTPRHILMQ